MVAIQEDDDLLSALFDGPFEQPMWQTFLERLRQRTRADGAGVSLRLPAGSQENLVRLQAGAVDWHNDAAFRELREERVYSEQDLVGVSGGLRVVRVTEPGGVAASISITRGRGAFSSADGALVSRMAPHFRRALRAYAELERRSAGARMAEDVMARLNFGWIRLDAKGVVMEESAEAARLLQHGIGLRRTRGGRLIAADPQVDRRLSAALRAIGDGRQPEQRAFNLSTDPWADMLLVPAVPAHGDGGAKHSVTASGEQSSVIAYIQGDNRSLADRHEQVAELFGLLPSEARLAIAMSRGQSIANAAESLGLSIETARNYSKKIYAKMGARGQADLIRFILTSVLARA